MKLLYKNIWAFVVLQGVLTTAQVKIGDNGATVNTSAMLELESTNKALVIPRLANTSMITTPVNGMLIYDLSSNCVKGYQNNAWSDCTALNTGFNLVGINAAYSANCANAVQTQSPVGYLINGQSYTGTYIVPYFNGDGTAYAASSVTVNGLTLTRPSGTYSGSGNVTYTMSGTYTGTTNMPVVFPVSECGSVVFGDNIEDNFAIGKNSYDSSQAICGTGEVLGQGRYYEGNLGSTTNNGTSFNIFNTDTYNSFKANVFTQAYQAVALDGGGKATLYLGQDGQVWASGENAGFGTLGQNSSNTPTTSYVPIQIKGIGGTGFLNGISKIEAAWLTNYAIRASDGALLGWGQNAYGQLGDGTTVDKYAPIQVKGVGGTGFLTNIIDVAGLSVNGSVRPHTCAAKSDGTAYCWGDNFWGQIGNGTTSGAIPASTTPVQVVGPGGTGVLTDVKDMAIEYQSSVAVKNDGTVWAWGNNDYGQLGQNISGGANQTSPIQVKGQGGIGFLTGIVKIEAYNRGYIALKNDGTVYAWGVGTYGQNGDGTTNQVNAPAKVKGVGGIGSLGNIISIRASERIVLALASDGKLYGWGHNESNSIAPATNGAIITTPILLSNYCLVK